MAEVVLKNVSKIYRGNVVAVKNVSLEVKDKEFVALVGPSGCGKSTTLRMIAGLEDVTQGEIYIDGQLVNQVHPKDRDIAMVFQNYALYPHMTVYKNMAFALRLRKYSNSEIEKRVKEAAEILGITELLARKPKELSGGERQRVAVGRAIVRHPKVFLFDEPLSNLDAKLRVQMRAEISKLHHRLQATMIYVTHDQIEAMTMGDQIVVMHHGQIQQVADPLTLYERPSNKFVAGFIGSPPMNFIDGKLKRKNERIYFQSNGFEVKLEEYINPNQNWILEPYLEGAVTMGIRPENIMVELERLEGHIQTVVDVVEPLGSEVILYLTVDGQPLPLIANVEAHIMPPVNSSMHVRFNMKKAHLFDMETGMAIKN